MKHLFPNLWLVGPPKTGTSTLYRLLAQHHNIVISRPKETFYLLDKSSPLLNNKNNYWKNRPINWKSYFEDGINDKIRLEGTTHLIYQVTVQQIISKNTEDPKAIAIYRDPSERIKSSFFYTRDTLCRMPKSISFSKYVKDLLECNDMEYIKHPKSRYTLENELNISKYSLHLKKWKNEFGPHNVLLLSFDDLVNKQQETATYIFNWLGLEFIDVKELIENKTISIRYPLYHTYLKSILGQYRNSSVLAPIKNFYKMIIEEPSGKHNLSKEDNEAFIMLKEYFSEEVELCKELTTVID